jgi:hypothetical protein
MLWKYKKCYQETNEDVVNPIIDLTPGQVSSSTLENPTNGCSILELVDGVFISQQNAGSITNGDIVYIDSGILPGREFSPFVGNSEYYKLKSIDSQAYIVTIDSDGVVASGYAMCFEL